MSHSPEAHGDRLNTLETTLTRFAELSFQSYRQHDETLNRLESNIVRLEATTKRNAQDIFELKGVVTDVATQQQRTDRAIESLTTTVTELVHSIAEEAIYAERDRQQATADRQAWQSEIQRIWEYLLQQGGNGKGGNGQATT